jgi:hypothetical protein
MNQFNSAARLWCLPGEGARPRAPGERVETQRCIFVRKIKARSASITTDRGDAIPPQNGSVFPKRTRINP